MNTINFNQIGGFPLSTDILAKLQTAFSIFNSLGNIVGDKTIISGCLVLGTNVSDGVVYVNGEVFEFRGGTAQTKVIIREDTENLVFQNENSFPSIKTRYVTFGTGIGAIDWADFKQGFATKDIPSDLNTRLAVIEKKLAIFQSGGAVFPWFKPVADIPEGFQEVLDIRGRTIIGYDPAQTEFNAIGKKAGAKSQTLAAGNLPEHDHLLFANEAADAGLVISNNNQAIKEGFNAGGDGNQNYRIRGSNNAATVGKSSKTGTSEAFSVLNPYAIAAYIEFVG